METNSVYAQVRELHPRLPAQVEVIDCTLRDGEQSPGVSFSVPEKIELARTLAKAGVTVLDAGFPAASGADREAMQAIRALGLPVRVAATARPLPGDVAAAEQAHATEIFMFMPTSDFRLSQTLGLSRREAELRLLSGAEDARGRGMGVNLVFEDATRADADWLTTVVQMVVARVPIQRVVAADTVGCAHPASIARLFETLSRRIGTSPILCAHCHNDFGLAGANTLATVAAGARAVTCTVNGIGERAGNADLAETVAGLTHLYGVEHGIDPLQLAELSRKVERMSGIHMSAHKPVTGFNVFRHESGVHADGMLKDSRSYEFLPSRWLGRQPEYVLGKHSGAAVVRELLASAGYEADDERVKRLLTMAKRLAETRDKALHAYAYKSKVALEAQLLTSLDVEDLLLRSDEIEHRKRDVVVAATKRAAGPSHATQAHGVPSYAAHSSQSAVTSGSVAAPAVG